MKRVESISSLTSALYFAISAAAYVASTQFDQGLYSELVAQIGEVVFGSIPLISKYSHEMKTAVSDEILQAGILRITNSYAVFFIVLTVQLCVELALFTIRPSFICREMEVVRAFIGSGNTTWGLYLFGVLALMLVMVYFLAFGTSPTLGANFVLKDRIFAGDFWVVRYLIVFSVLHALSFHGAIALYAKAQHTRAH